MGGGGGFLGGIGDAIGDVFEGAGKVLGQVGNAVADVGEFVGNVVGGTIQNAIGIAEGIVTGDWNKVRDSVIGTVTTVVAVGAIVVGGVLGVAAGVTMLDAQHNKGKILGNVIATAGDAEHYLFGTNNINNAAMEIQVAISFAASVYASYVVMPMLLDATGISGAMAAIPAEITNAAQVAYYSYDIYNTVNGVIQMREYYEAQLAEYERKMREWLAKAEAAKEQWFGVMTDYDMRNRIMPGGDLYNGGAGSYYYNPTAPHEGGRWLLSMEAGNDGELDEMIMGRKQNYLAGGQGYYTTIEGEIKWPR